MFIASGSCLVKKSYQQAIIAQNERRKEHTRKLIDAYNDEQLQFLKDEIISLYRGKNIADELRPLSINIMQKITNRLASVYVQNAIRIIKGNERDQALYSSFEKDASIALKMKACNRLTTLTGNTLLRVLWRNNKAEIDVLTGDLYDVHCGDAPDDIQGITITKYSDTGQTHDLQYTLWTPETIYHLDHNKQEISQEPNIYGILPFVSVYSQIPIESYWQNGLNSLLSAQEAINMRLTELCHTLRMQGFSVGVATGGKNGNSTLELGPASYLHLPQDSKFTFESPDAPIVDTIKAIEFIIQQTGVSYGIPADALSTTPTGESGLSKIVSSVELTERRQDQIALFTNVEQSLFSVWRHVHNIHSTQRISDNAELQINFHEPKPVTSALETLQEQSQLMEMGLMSPVDILMQRDPDLSREDAQIKLLQVKDDLQEFNKLSTI